MTKGSVKRLRSACLMGALSLAPTPSRAEAPAAERGAAAALYDEGVSKFEHADYAAAARAFLRADELSPSADAVVNALAAARRANDHLLVVEAAERGIAREAAQPDLAAQSREALSQAARSLARVDLRCEPEPCKLSLNGAATRPGARYVLPGTTLVAASSSDGNRTEEALSLVAGATYSVLLHAVKKGEAARATQVKTETRDSQGPGRDARAAPAPSARDASSKPLSPAVFYVGVGVTVVLSGLTAWSGIDTLSAKSDLSRTPSSTEVEAVRSKMHRSDALFAGAAVAGLATVAAGFFWVDWGGEHRLETSVFPAEGGAFAAAAGRF